MKKIGFLLIALLSSAAHAAFIPVGVQEDVALTTVTNDWDWNLIYRGDYADSVSLADVFASADEYVMLGAIFGGSDTIELLAAIKYSDFIVHTPRSQTKQINGAEWYNNGGSVGFAGLGDTIAQNSADTVNVNAGQRLSWHGQQGGYGTVATSLIGGWRAGAATGLNSSTAWDRVVFTASANPVEVSVAQSWSCLLLGMLSLLLARAKSRLPARNVTTSPVGKSPR